MTFKQLAAKIARMSPEELKKKVLIETFRDGNFLKLMDIFKAEEDMYYPECAPGERRHDDLCRAGFKPKPIVKRGEWYLGID